MAFTDPQTPIRIFTVDDHPILREGIESIIRLQPNMILAGEAENGAEAVEGFRRLRPDVTLMDIQMPVLNGIEATKIIRSEFPSARIIVLTTYAGDAQAVRALRAGAAGYLLKNTLRKELVEAITAVHAGRRHIPPEIARQISDHFDEETLSERELQILRLVAAGKANKEIAVELNLADDTIKAHLRRIFAKLGANDRTQAAILAVKRGLIEI